MRSLLALVLLGAVSANECPIAGMISWLKEHGEEVLETIDDCKDVPSIIRNLQEETKGCYAEQSTANKAAVGLWYAITGLEHLNGTIGEFVKHSPMMEMIKRLTTQKYMAISHESAAKMCGNAKCEDKAMNIQSTIGSCYTSLSCKNLGKIFPFASCKAAMDKYMMASMTDTMRAMCQSDSIRGRPVYCVEVAQGSIVSWYLFCKSGDCSPHARPGAVLTASAIVNRNSDFDCFLERSQIQECTPKCKREWEFEKSIAPKCSKMVTDMPDVRMRNLRTMMEDMNKDAKIDMWAVKLLPKHLPTYDDKCGLQKEVMV